MGRFVDSRHQELVLKLEADYTCTCEEPALAAGLAT